MDYPCKRTYVYTGYVPLEGGKTGVALELLNGSFALTGEQIYFDKKAMSGSMVGSMYEVVQSSENSWQLRNRLYVGQYPGTEQVMEWQLKAKAEDALRDARRLEKNESVAAALAALAPLRKIYARQLPSNKRAIELLLIEYLRRL